MKYDAAVRCIEETMRRIIGDVTTMINYKFTDAATISMCKMTIKECRRILRFCNRHLHAEEFKDLNKHYRKLLKY